MHCKMLSVSRTHAPHLPPPYRRTAEAKSLRCYAVMCHFRGSYSRQVRGNPIVDSEFNYAIKPDSSSGTPKSCPLIRVNSSPTSLRGYINGHKNCGMITGTYSHLLIVPIFLTHIMQVHNEPATKMTRKLAVALIDTSRVFKMFISVILVCKHFATSFALVSGIGCQNKVANTMISFSFIGAFDCFSKFWSFSEICDIFDRLLIKITMQKYAQGEVLWRITHRINEQF